VRRTRSSGQSDGHLLATLATDRDGVVARITDLERDLDAIAESTKDGPDDEHDADGSTVAYERARVSFLLAQAKGRLAAIEEATVQARAGLHGRCDDCGNPIGEERLEALPATRRCVRCASAR
jgi:DnaK suppressor protein